MTQEQHDSNNLNLKQTLRAMQTGLFATKDSIQEAVQFAYDVINAGSGDKAAMYTVIHVLMNTIAEEVKRKIEEETSITMLGEDE